MEMKHLFRAAALAATMLTAAACIYPFSPELQHGGELPLVVEGDIFLGTYTTLTLSHVRPFGEENAQDVRSLFRLLPAHSRQRRLFHHGPDDLPHAFI